MSAPPINPDDPRVVQLTYEEAKPLKDVHVVLCVACHTAVDLEDPNNITVRMVQLGADIAIGFQHISAHSETEAFLRLFLEYLRDPAHTIASAARLAARNATNARGRSLREEAGEPGEQEVGIKPGIGIDLAKEKLVPGRYGNSAN
jgi:hypothetical protein